MLGLPTGAVDCQCSLVDHEPKRIAITGGPGAGKTAILEMAKQMFCEHVAILPEAAGIVFGGGFPRNSSESARRAAQGAIYHVQRMVEQLAEDEGAVAVALCDRGTVDGARYYPQMISLGRWHEEPWLWSLFDKSPTPNEVASLSALKIERILRKHKIRRHEAREVFERLSSVALPVAPGVAAAVSERIGLLLPMLRVAHEQRTSCSTQLAKLFVQEREPHGDESSDTGHSDAAIVLSFPGIGIHNGAAMLAEAHVALQLRDYQAFRRRAGAAPVSKRTGGKQNKPKVIQRRACSQPLRNAVYHWTRTAAQCEPRARSHYVALRAQGHSHGRALRGIGDRLIKSLMAALKSGQLYDPNRRQVPENLQIAI